MCRVYSFADEHSKALDILTRSHFDPKRDKYISVFEDRYKLRLETTLSMKAKEFMEAAKHGDVDEFIIKADLQLGDIVEIDDGLKSYCFYYWSWSIMVPTCHFNRALVKKEN